MDKTRVKVNEVAEMKVLIGNVKDKDCIIIDDMIDTGGTMMKSINELKKLGAKRIYVFVTHGLFNGNFYQNFKSC